MERRQNQVLIARDVGNRLRFGLQVFLELIQAVS